MILESKKNENINQESNKQLDAAIATWLVSQNLFETILDTKTQTKDTVKNYLHLVKFYQQKFPNSQTLDLNNKVANVLNTLPNDFDYKTIKSEITSLPKSIIQHLLWEKNNQINDNQEQAIVALFEDKTKQAPEAYKKAFTDWIWLNINELWTPAQKYIKKHMPKPIQIT
jgi:hypothetical protein